ncbi:MAG TPA: site-2 protease family protein [Deltaproteobacteria bacterium]|nr:MAG: peptidase [Deltaproteobacteria bacterium GWB2_42_7]OGP39439.1 MAG: peptidase [Deltaproteobacteria bacterium GWD2_42_10]OGP47669.1 MAG: peptidase [Deltaproteobacteria bacterium GWF2_42_12]OGQ25831.1 MAG: peptidase [Deltaproteobacteria bacterium RIFCSPHIGHO2_02_FULL_42_44]OGQ36990.1 MAG: peptidase [Deltaproteobacteria bacterium RIFCSPLOWO2_02_FULL_42_39]OGQ68212.1 MAG: peptidase [Deltaproteobacteria bacterium RIFCSPLOWO2_12_FULL_42_16]OGQ72229.1 MAG: peptidase [Deltaproteobacteria bacte
MESVIRDIAILLVPILLAVTFHEMAHGWVADKLGDPTARLLGRITLNPIKHLDPIGTLVFFLTHMIGWARPVPVNPLHFKDPVKGMMWVAIAGPVTNLFLAAVSAIIFRIILVSGLLFDPSISFIMKPIYMMVQASVIINIGLAVFNILPIPPLDGSKILMGLLSREQAEVFARIEPYGFLILILLIMTDIVSAILSPIIGFSVGLLLEGRF